MYVIAVYDISTVEKAGKRRLPKVMKTMRKYLQHQQKSVFVGELREAQLVRLEMEIKKIIDIEEDSVLFYVIANAKNVICKSLGLDFSLDNFII